MGRAKLLLVASSGALQALSIGVVAAPIPPSLCLTPRPVCQGVVGWVEVLARIQGFANA
jgi:hypothetical protein